MATAHHDNFKRHRGHERPVPEWERLKQENEVKKKIRALIANRAPEVVLPPNGMLVMVNSWPKAEPSANRVIVFWFFFEIFFVSLGVLHNVG